MAEPLIAYADEHDHVCPICLGIVLHCRAVRASGSAPILPDVGATRETIRHLFGPDAVPGEPYGDYLTDDYARRTTKLHDGQLQLAVRSHQCPTDEQIDQYRAYLRHVAEHGVPPNAPRIRPRR